MNFNKFVGGGAILGGFILAANPPRYGGLLGSLVFLAAGLIITLWPDRKAPNDASPPPDLEAKVRELQQQCDALTQQVSTLSEQHDFVHSLLTSRSANAGVIEPR